MGTPPNSELTRFRDLCIMLIMPKHVLKVEGPYHQIRLDVFLMQILPEPPSRTTIKKLIETGQVMVNQKFVKVHHKVQLGDAVVVNLPEEEPLDQKIRPEEIPLEIIYEDESLIIINKPVGMLVHPARGIYTGTLVNALLNHSRNLSSVNVPERPGIVHRLDRQTSGLIVVAKDNPTHRHLAKQFEQYRVPKRYMAIVAGEVEHDEGMIDAPLGQHHKHFDLKAVSFDELAKEARTLYKVLKRSKGKTLVALYPKTGRTHQLRVHMAYLGHPILGDDRYGKVNSLHRLALHAQSIGFIHPGTQRFVEFSIPMPQEFLRIMQA